MIQKPMFSLGSKRSLHKTKSQLTCGCVISGYMSVLCAWLLHGIPCCLYWPMDKPNNKYGFVEDEVIISLDMARGVTVSVNCFWVPMNTPMAEAMICKLGIFMDFYLLQIYVKKTQNRLADIIVLGQRY